MCTHFMVFFTIYLASVVTKDGIIAAGLQNPVSYFLSMHHAVFSKPTVTYTTSIGNSTDAQAQPLKLF